VVLDEFASMHRAAFPEVIRPALSDRMGKALFIGTPKGRRNHFYEIFQSAGEQPDWSAFQYTTEQGGLVSKEEVEQARRELDERTFRTEYQASFESLGVGLAYFAFDRAKNVGVCHYNPNFPLFWALDFNRDPLCSVVGHWNKNVVLVLDELIVPKSYTLAACEEFLERTKDLAGRPLKVHVYGDPAGSSEHTSASRTDWQIVRDFFGRYPDRFSVTFCVPSSHPLQKDRVNCVNAMLCNHAGQQRLFIRPHCKQLIKDFEQVCWKADANGNAMGQLDKSDPMRTHASDALGYFIAREFGMRPIFGERGGPPLC